MSTNSNRHGIRKSRGNEIINEGSVIQDNNAQLGVCVRTPDQTVIEQNSTCETICGPHIGETCSTCDPEEGYQAVLNFQKHAVVSGQEVQLVTIQDQHQMTTLLHPVAQEIQTIKSKLASLDLTPAELEIVDLLLEKKKNQEILDQLSIKKSTLKTHLNHIYQKAPFLKAYRS